MAQLIDGQKWLAAFKKTDWYVDILADFNQLEEIASQEKDYDKRKALKAQAYDLVDQALQTNQIALAKTGKDFDEDRRPIDTIVIHHTASKPGMALSRLNAIHLLRLYARYYNNPRLEDENLRGQAVWSGHFYEGKQIFWAYHWLVKENGTAEHILEDKYIGWHSGNWDINTRSIAICIDAYLQDKEPSEQVLKSMAEVIKTNYPNVKNIIGHREVNPNTECPGNLFLTSWKEKFQIILDLQG